MACPPMVWQVVNPGSVHGMAPHGHAMACPYKCPAAETAALPEELRQPVISPILWALDAWKKPVRRLTPLIGAVILLCAVVFPLASQDDPCTQRSFLVTVIDREGHPVPGLTAANFRGKFRGKPVQIESAVFDTGPRRMVIVLDISGSMMRGNESKVARLLALDAVQMNRDDSPLALTAFATSVIASIGFDRGNLELSDRLVALLSEKSITPRNQGITALYDALDAAVGLLTPAQPGDIVYALTDGIDTASHVKASQVEKALVERGVRLFAAVPAGNLGHLYRGSMEGFQRLRQMVQATGGGQLSLFSVSRYSAVYWWNEDQKAALLSLATILYQQMRMTYRIKVQLSSDLDKPREWDLEFVNYQNQRRDDWMVLCPRKLLPCSQTTAAPSAHGAIK